MSSSVVTIPLISTDGSPPSSRERSALAPDPHRFVVGPENTLVHVLLDAVAALPPRFNPITVFGPTGVGKSHLLHGIVEQHRSKSSDNRIVLVTGADFSRGFARAIEVDSISEWRTKQRTVNLFVLDDLQELSTKPPAQQELVQTLDSLLEQDRQILLACRHSLFDWKWMLPALRSRIAGGLTIPIALPSIETRQFMLNELIAGQKISPSAPFELPAYSLPTTYTQLRQAVQQHFESELFSHVAANERPPSASPPSISRIAKFVARQLQVKHSELVGPSRRQTTVRARGVAIFLVRTLLQLSLEEIGQYFGKRDHTTVLHALRKTTELLETNVTLKQEVNKLTSLLTGHFEIQPPARPELRLPKMRPRIEPGSP